MMIPNNLDWHFEKNNAFLMDKSNVDPNDLTVALLYLNTDTYGICGIVAKYRPVF